MIRRIISGATVFTLVLFVLASGFAAVRAANNSTLNQTINFGTLVTDIRDASRVSVVSPTVAFSATTFSFTCLTGGSRPSGTFGTNTERIYVDNPGAADGGWTLALAATGGGTDSWDNGGATVKYDYNDPNTSGCGDGSDADSLKGQMSVDPSVGTLTADCLTCVITNISKGSSSAYSEEAPVVSSITLLNAALASDDIGRWYLTGVDIDQTIPAEQADDSYSINMTLTVTAS